MVMRARLDGLTAVMYVGARRMAVIRASARVLKEKGVNHAAGFQAQEAREKVLAPANP
jgi:hypothetical protein